MIEVKKIHYYGKYDLINGSTLIEIERILDNLDTNKNYTLEEFIEFYNIKKFFDNDIYSINWDETKKNKYKILIKTIETKRFKFFNDLNEEDIVNSITNLSDDKYRKDFWEIMNYGKLYDKITNIVFAEILNHNPGDITHILLNKNLVNKFDKVLKEFIVSYDYSINFLINNIRTDIDEKYIFPKSLTLEDKNQIIEKFIEKNSGFELSKLEYFENLLKNDFLTINDKLKLKIRKSLKQYKDNIFNSENATIISNNFKVGFDGNQLEAIKLGYESNTSYIIFSKNYLYNIDYRIEGIYIFIVFDLINPRLLFQGISKKSDFGLVEQILNKQIPNYYNLGSSFFFRENLFLLQLKILDDFLKKFKGVQLKEILNYFIKNIKKYKGLENIDFELQDDKLINYGERIGNVFSKFDSLIKQYDCFVEEGYIDFELLKISSKPLIYEDINSLLDNKYFYEKSEVFLNLRYYFFSNQSHIYYLEKLKNVKNTPYEYKNFYELITKENIRLEDYDDIQVVTITNELINKNYILEDENGFLRIIDEDFIFLIGELDYYGELSYYGYSDKNRKKIIEMHTKGYLEKRNKLLSKKEGEYIDFYLNKKKFMNGYDIRNKYIHGSSYADQNEAYRDYLMTIMILGIILLKIDFELREKFGF